MSVLAPSFVWQRLFECDKRLEWVNHSPVGDKWVMTLSGIHLRLRQRTIGQSVSVLHVFMVNCSPWTRDVPRLNVTNTNVSESVSVLAAFQEKSWRSVVCLSWITVVRCYQKLSERNLLIRLIWKFLKALRF